MADFSHMTLKELTGAWGHDCVCGRHHVCGLEYLSIAPGALNGITDMLKALGSRRPYIICDRNTLAAAGQRVCALLDRQGVPYVLYTIPCRGERIAPAEWEVGSAVMHFDPRCDLILGVGSGVVNDICKVVARAIGRKNAIVGTAPSMDGYASNSSSMEVNHVKVSLYNQAPSGILLDVDVLAQAPMRMLWAGLGDMVAKYIAIAEWRISHLVTGEYYCENIASLMRGAVKKVVDAADGLPSRQPEAVQAIAEGLVLAGVAMAYAEFSRPASGLEHYFSHMWEMMALERGEPYDLHGIQVGVGTLLTLRLCRDLRHEQPDREKALDYWRRMTPERWTDQINAVFGKTAPEILRVEAEKHKNDPERHLRRLDRICAHWDQIITIMNEELPDDSRLTALMSRMGMPLLPRDIGINAEDTVNAFIGSRDIRDKYLTSTLLWDLGLTEEYAEKLRRFVSA